MTRIPRLLVLTDRRRCEREGRDLGATLGAALDAGAPAVVFREKDLDRADRRRLGVEVAQLTRSAGAQLIVASDPRLAVDLGADALHLAATDPLPAGVAEPAKVVGRSCHDLSEVMAADAEPLGYLVVSPVAPTASKPGYGPPLGVDGVARLAAATRLPVLGLGGVTPTLARDLVTAQVHGVAVLGGVMGAADPAAAVTDLLAALDVT